MQAASFVPELGAPLIDLLQPQPGERVLDLGCGEGTLTARLAATGAVVVGVDASAEMVEAARARGLDARLANGTDLHFKGEFDAVFSNAAMHWMRDLPAVLGGVFRALRPGGRFIGELGGEGNVAAVRDALAATLAESGIDAKPLDPWVFPAEDGFADMLEAAGFRIDRLERFDRPTPLPGDIADWLRTFAGAFFAAVPESERAGLAAQVRDRLALRLRSADGGWWVDNVRLRFVAGRPVGGGD